MRKKKRKMNEKENDKNDRIEKENKRRMKGKRKQRINDPYHGTEDGKQQISSDDTSESPTRIPTFLSLRICNFFSPGGLLLLLRIALANEFLPIVM